MSISECAAQEIKPVATLSASWCCAAVPDLPFLAGTAVLAARLGGGGRALRGHPRAAAPCAQPRRCGICRVQGLAYVPCRRDREGKRGRVHARGARSWPARALPLSGAPWEAAMVLRGSLWLGCGGIKELAC